MATDTKVYHIRIEHGVIAEIVGADVKLESPLPKYDCKELLMLPSFDEAHIHLDKTYFDGSWTAVKKASSIFDRIEEEEDVAA